MTNVENVKIYDEVTDTHILMPLLQSRFCVKYSTTDAVLKYDDLSIL